MNLYRLYFLDDEDHIRHRVDFHCNSDDQAIEAVAAHVDGRAMELWEVDRFIRRFPKQTAPRRPALQRARIG
jgi:hypothetical protein